MSQVHLWCLYNQQSDTCLEGLFFDEARAVVSSLDESERAHWFAWKEGWSAWKPLSEVDGLTEVFVRTLKAKMPATPSSHSETETFGTRLEPGMIGAGVVGVEEPEDSVVVEMSSDNKFFDALKENVSSSKSTFDGNSIIQLSEDPNKVFINREFTRYKKEFEITILHSGQIFKTTTVDISVGGLYLKDALPAWVAGYFKVKILAPKSNQQIELTCCLVENQSPAARYRVAFLPLKNPNDQDTLESWIKAA